MMPINGKITSFKDYLALTSRPCPSPVIWKGNDIKSALSTLPHEERGTIVLSNPCTEPATIAPDLSFAIQVIRRGEETKTHAHSFWHLYIVQSGIGETMLNNQSNMHIEAGDVIFIPAWCLHKFGNCGQQDLLVLFVLQNLPQSAALGNLMREEISGEKTNIYAELYSKDVSNIENKYA